MKTSTKNLFRCYSAKHRVLDKQFGVFHELPFLVTNKNFLLDTFHNKYIVNTNFTKRVYMAALDSENKYVRNLPLETFCYLSFTGTEFNKYFGNRHYVKPILDEKDDIGEGLCESYFKWSPDPKEYDAAINEMICFEVFDEFGGIYFLENGDYHNLVPRYNEYKFFRKVKIPNNAIVGIDKHGLCSNRLLASIREDITILKRNNASTTTN